MKAAPASIFARLTEQLAAGEPAPFDFIVADEAQDFGVAEMRFLAALTGGRPDSLLLTGTSVSAFFDTVFMEGAWRRRSTAN